MASWKDKFSKFLDNLSEPIDGFRDDPDSGRGEPLFKKGDKVITWDNEKGTVTRKMEYGDGWAYGLKLDNGKLVKAMRQKDLKPLEEARQMKITTKKLRSVIREELQKINESKVGVDDPIVMSWIKFVGSASGYLEELEKIWNLIRSGEYTKDDLDTVPSELHRGIRFHTTFKNMHQKAKQGVVYPTWDEVIDKLRELVTKQKADRAARAKIPTGYRADPKYQAASDHEKERWHQYGGDPSDPGRARGLGT